MNHPAAAIDDSAIFPCASDSPCPRLLIVEDDGDMRELHVRVLNLQGYQVETACDGAAALERLAEEEFDLVVTDRAMPNLDGVSMVLALRSAGSQIPIVMVSGVANAEEQAAAWEAGVNAYLDKNDLRMGALVSTLRGLLDGPAA